MIDRLEKAGFFLADLRSIAVMGSSDAERHAVKANLGISFLFIRALHDEIQTGRFAADASLQE